MGLKAAPSPAPTEFGLSAAQVDSIGAARERATRRLAWREVATETIGAASFLGAAAILWAVFAGPRVDLWVAVWLGLLCAVLTRIEFEVGEGRTRPVVLALVPMLLLLPAPAVPLVFAAGHLAARLPDVVRGRAPAWRLVMMLGDSWFAIAPALVFALFGLPAGVAAAALAVTVAVLAESVADFSISALRFWTSVGVGPRSQLRAYAWVYLVDVLLAPVGLLAGMAGRESPITVVAVIPLAALIALFAHERRGRIENALALQRMTEESRDRLQSIVQNSSDLIVILDADGALHTVTGSIVPIFGESLQRAQQGSLLDRVHPDDTARVREVLAFAAGKPAGESTEAEWRMRYADDTYRHIAAVATNLIDDPRVGGLVLTARDVEARKVFEEQLRHRAFHDELTGLANRALFFDRVEHALTRGSREDANVAVMFVDLDDFKPINDRLGHAAGDQVLQQVAKRLDACMRTADTVARLGGDEFGVVLEGIAGPGRAVQAAERLLEALERPIEVAGEAVRLSASIGIALSEADARGVEDLLRKGDLAMYEAKRSGKRRLALYEPEMSQADTPGRRPLTWFVRSDEQRAEVLSLLEDDDALTMVFQPIMDLRTGRVAGYEALARFNRTPYRPPDQWFAQAHRCGLGYAVEAKALAAALAVGGRPAGTYLAVNLSPSSLTAAEIQRVLPQRLDDLVIEVTENELASGDPAIGIAIAALRSRGARLAVDDTGAGYAGLTHVMRLAPDVIKLDRTLTTGIEADPVKAALVSSFVRYAREIDATVLGEGIETFAELTRLADLDVAYGQGYLLARPAPPWAALDSEASAACEVSFRTAFAETVAEGAGRDQDRSLERLAGLLARATSAADLEACLRPVADELGADEVRIVSAHSGGAGQVLADDPTADPALVAALVADGYRALLTLPIAQGAHLHAFSRADRPWTRFEIGRGRIISYQLGAVLARIDAGEYPQPPAGVSAVRATARRR